MIRVPEICWLYLPWSLAAWLDSVTLVTLSAQVPQASTIGAKSERKI